MGQSALAVIRQDHHIGVGQHFLEIRQLAEQHFVTRRRLEIDAQQLLLPPDHAQLDGGIESFIAVQHHVDALVVQQAGQAVARLVLARHRQQGNPGAQRRGIARHVGGAARPLLGATDMHHRHRRLGRNAAHLAEPVTVEHDVADDQDAGIFEIR